MSIPSAVDLATRLIAFNTINPPGEETAAARFVGSLLESQGFAVTYHEMSPGRTSLVANRGGAAPDRTGAPRPKPICFTGHHDTVPLGTAPWSVDPLRGTLIDGKLYGRGSSDMKGGVAAMVVAAMRSLDEIDRGPGVVLVLTAGEETGCDGARHLASRAGALGEAGAIVVGEPTSNQPRVGHKGALWLNADTHGVTAHGSMPELGVNALYRGARMATKLEDFGFNAAPHAVLGSPTLNVGRMTAGLNVNSVPDHAELGIDIRTVPGLDHDHVRHSLHSYLAPDLATMTTLLDLQPVWTSLDTPWVKRVFAITDRYLTRDAKPRGAPFFTDASILKSAYGDAPTIILGPGEQNMAHRTDEYCWANKIEEAVDIYRDIIGDWNASHVNEELAHAEPA